MEANLLSPVAYVLAVGYIAWFCLGRVAPRAVGWVRVGERTSWFVFALTLALVLASWSVTLVRHAHASCT